MTLKTYYRFFRLLTKRFRSYLLSFFPRRLPQGLAEFNAFAAEIISLSGLPDNDSTRFSVAVNIMHLGPQDADKPKRYFVRTLQKGAAAQVASHVINELKEKQAAQQKAAQLAAAPDTSGAANVQNKSG